MKLNKIVAVALGVILTSSTALSQVGAADAASKLIGSTKAKEIMLKKVPGAKIVKFRLDNDNTPEYEGELTKGSYKYEIDVNAKSGKVTDYEKETIRTSSSKYIGEAKAKEIMLKKVPGAEIVKFKLDKDDTAEYEGELRKGNYEYEISVNAKTGKISDYEKEIIKTSSSKYIGETKAKEIMLKKVPGAKIVKFELDNDKTPEYEGELKKGNYEYEITVNAITGKITEFEKDND
ncbi:PepSY domain-containing protein [Terrisporobacter petrolearius]|uniref:PepSY domain-containing protein n=1 Tax=Terrisporobacter petrolearius TaxID=1460447 RepID=UPI0022E5EDA4|nr:PepSY domain-containing protein [Terrisporobacter petrolearius]